MERKDFLKNSIGFLGLAVAAPSILRAREAVNPQASESALACSVTNSETAGPFPTHTPSSLVSSNIISDRTGVPFTININIMNINANCGALQGALVDIWHCDKDGYYSEYGGTGMQPQDFTAYHFLRGRQTTDANGLVSFTSIFPGWYSGRATHIHVHIYNAAGTSLLVTQIAFPEGTNSAVALVNASTENGYTKGMSGYTYNSSDNVFSDGVTNEMSTLTGSVAAGYVLNHTIYVAGPTLGINEVSQQSFGLGQNYPNPVKSSTIIPLNLNQDSQVSVQLFDMTGRLISTPINKNLSAGNNQLTVDRNGLSSGYYIYKVKVVNQEGSFEQSRKMLFE
ncbi:MAG TPA: T9SS type A sorting domain-containing protein [Flavobacterium sp.]|uniref:T9SS type A sorting domain-containing protein n=1 Tax=Flavobacterium sp. TaxID=239 RepID=UPI002BF170DA|nr:T9SS type A sorting domain-containing protein [Flavobacterium sp.]HNP33085.1 T9SS type A sorting domain-containing protein [Flavobacterium sp.]